MRKAAGSARALALACGLLAPALSAQTDGAREVLGQIEDPYARAKNGPPLKDVVHKVNSRWLYDWLRAPEEYDATARMPNLELTDDEIQAVMAYLVSIASPEVPRIEWAPYLAKSEFDMDEDEWMEMDVLYEDGKRVWSRARCTICHAADGRGGFLDLGVAIDLSRVAGKVDRDWLYHWIREPKATFPDTRMPRFRFTEDEARALVEYVLRDTSFAPMEEEDEEDEQAPPSPAPDYSELTDPALALRGKRVIELTRCVVCHDIEGIPEILPAAPAPVEAAHPFAQLANDIRCLTCHTIDGVGGTYAPELTQEGDKLRTEWLETFLATPDTVRPVSQQMPRFNLQPDEVQVAIDFIKESLLAREPLALTPSLDDHERGRELFESKGCRSCHALGTEGGALGPDLTAVAERLEPGHVFRHLKRPQVVNPLAIEPSYGLSDAEAAALAAFLLAPREGESE